jgi:hypothetical protein
MRLAFKTPINFNNWHIYNGSQRKPFVEYRFNVPSDTLLTIFDAQLNIPAQPRLQDVLKIVGSHASLWIGTYKGIVAPMDVEPMGWSWDIEGEKPVPSQVFWQWHPDRESTLRLLEEANQFSNNPESVFSREGIFKQLVPANLSHQHEKIEDIEGIPIQRLADMVYKEADWVFEFDKRDTTLCP